MGTFRIEVPGGGAQYVDAPDALAAVAIVGRAPYTVTAVLPQGDPCARCGLPADGPDALTHDIAGDYCGPDCYDADALDSCAHVVGDHTWCPPSSCDAYIDLVADTVAMMRETGCVDVDAYVDLDACRFHGVDPDILARAIRAAL